jgi:hypothetical protein
MFGAVYLGHPDVEFKIANKDPMLHVEPIKFKNFQLVVMFSLHPLRSHYTTEIGSSVTYDPESVSGHKKILYGSLMKGKSANICVAQYQIAVWAMLRRVLKIELQEATDPEAIKDIKKRIRRLPKPRIHTGLSTEGRLTKILYPPSSFDDF